MSISATGFAKFHKNILFITPVINIPILTTNISVSNIALHTAVRHSGIQPTEHVRQCICWLMKHQTSSLQLCGQQTVLTLTQSTTRFGEAAGACVPQPDSWRQPAEVAPDRKVGTFSPGGHR